MPETPPEHSNLTQLTESYLAQSNQSSEANQESHTEAKTQPELIKHRTALEARANELKLKLEEVMTSGDEQELQDIQEDINQLETESIQLEQAISHLEAQATFEALGLDLSEQYHQQIDSLTEAGLVKDGTIKAIDGQSYPIPTLEQITQSLTPEKAEIIKAKSEQGFTKLLLVPFGMSIAELSTAYGERLKATYSAGKLVDSNGNKQDLDTSQPVLVWDELEDADTNDELVYYPQAFDQNKHQGKTKQQLINSNQAWQVLLVEDMLDIPDRGRGETTSGRAQLEAGDSPNNYLAQLGQASYHDELGLTPEAWLTLALNRLHSDNQVLDSWQTGGNSDYLIASYLPSSGVVPCAYWYADSHRALLDRRVPGFVLDRVGLRSAVRVL